MVITIGYTISHTAKLQKVPSSEFKNLVNLNL